MRVSARPGILLAPTDRALWLHVTVPGRPGTVASDEAGPLDHTSGSAAADGDEDPLVPPVEIWGGTLDLHILKGTASRHPQGHSHAEMRAIPMRAFMHSHA